MQTRNVLRVAILLAGLLGGARAAQAYPQWQLSTGAARCNQCHYAPAGGGLINNFGRDAAGEDLSTYGGNGAFLHGAVELPSWLALGADLRGAFATEDVQDPSGNTTAVFPMQADVYARVALPWGFSLSATGGFRDQVRQPGILVPIQNYQPIDTSTLISREHYLMWQPESIGPYVRVGRFFAPFGLRLAEHILYIRRDLGFNLLEETYNVSAGFVFPEAEIHLTAFGPDFVRHIGSNEKGFAGYLERRLWNDQVALAGQVRLAQAPGVTRLIFGGVGKAYAEPIKTLFMAEVDGVNAMYDDASQTTRQQIVGLAGFTVLPAKGLMFTVLGERNQVDVDAPTSWTAGTFMFNCFPYAHFEVQIMERLEYPQGGQLDNTFFIQLHYYL